MEIAFITKYAPVQGGTASRAYWLIRGLAKKGHKINVITNSWETEKEYRIKLPVEYFEGYRPKNVDIFSTSPFDNPKHIPYSPSYLAKLSSLSLDVAVAKDVDLIDTWYILPYGIAGYLTKATIKKKLVIRHAGSDMTRLFEYPYLHSIFVATLRAADKIVTYPSVERTFTNVGVKRKQLKIINKSGVDISEFNPSVKSLDMGGFENYREDVPTICYIGKAERAKGVFDLIEALGRIRNMRFNLMLVTSSNKDRLNKALKDNGLDKKTTFLDYVPPWVMPRVIRTATCVVAPEHDFPVPIHNPILPREILASGTCLAISTDLCRKMPYSMLKGNEALIFDPRDQCSFTDNMKRIIDDVDYARELGKAGRRFAERHECFNEELDENIKMYKEML